MFKLADWCYSKLPPVTKHPRFWLWMWLLWFTILWALSSRSPDFDKKGPDIPHLDKVAHFCYFMAGGFCFANFLYLRKSFSERWKKIILCTFLAGSLTGTIDEYHQTKIPGRTGNDLGDWIADITGTTAGAYYCLYMWRRLKKRKAFSNQITS